MQGAAAGKGLHATHSLGSQAEGMTAPKLPQKPVRKLPDFQNISTNIYKVPPYQGRQRFISMVVIFHLALTRNGAL